MSSMAILTHGSSISRPRIRSLMSFNRRYVKQTISFNVEVSHFSHQLKKSRVPRYRNPSVFLVRSFPEDHTDNSSAKTFIDKENGTIDDSADNKENKTSGATNSFIVKLAIAMGIAAVVTIVSSSLKPLVLGSSSFGIQRLADVSSPSVSDVSAVGFTFKAFGYRIVLPEYAPGWVYFWLFMAAACGLFISEEALNIWIGISLSRLLSLDGTWKSFAESFSRNAPYIISTLIWVYWGVCISDMIPFYLGKLFRQTKTSGDVYSKLGIGKERALDITKSVQRYGNLIGFVERFSLGVRNPTAFLAGALGISPERFFIGVCFGGLITLPFQLFIGFMLRERPMFAIASVATIVGIWTVFPYMLAASTALFLFLRRRYST